MRNKSESVQQAALYTTFSLASNRRLEDVNLHMPIMQSMTNTIRNKSLSKGTNLVSPVRINTDLVEVSRPTAN